MTSENFALHRTKLAFYLEGRYLIKEESQFVHILKEELDNFLEDRGSESILVFPPFLSRYRYLAHKIIDEYFFPALCSFSIGPEEKRLFIVGQTAVIARCCLPFRCVHDKLEHLFYVEKPVACICSARLKSLKIHPPVRGSSPNTKRRESMKDLKSERSASSAMENKRTDRSQRSIKERQKRPDMQLYVPRALRGVENKTVSEKNAYGENLNEQNSKKLSQKSRTASLTNSCDNLPDVSSESKHNKNSVDMHLKPKNIKNELCYVTKLSADDTTAECTAASNNVASSEIVTISTSYSPTRTDIAQNFLNSLSACGKAVMPCSSISVSNDVVASETVAISTSYLLTRRDTLQNSSSTCEQTVIPFSSACSENTEMIDNVNATVSKNNIESIDQSVIVKSTLSRFVDIKKGQMDFTVESAPCKVVNTETNYSVPLNMLSYALDTKSEVSCTATPDSSYASDMDSLNISDKSNETDVSLTTDTPPKEKDDSWESMFDDNGECLDSNLVKELSSVTGQIQIRAAKNNYTDYQQLSESVPQEYENIVELYGFPREFVTQDLVSAFSVFQQSTFSIKWVDDCHALAIFTSPTLANQALQMKHPFMKVRPLSEGIKESKAKARWCAHHSEPVKPRPATSAVLARRLVSGALGLRVQASKEQRDHERSVLKEAKEKRRQKAKQKEAIWDGSVI